MSETPKIELDETAWSAAADDLRIALAAGGIKTNGIPAVTLAGIAIRSYLAAKEQRANYAVEALPTPSPQ